MKYLTQQAVALQRTMNEIYKNGSNANIMPLKVTSMRREQGRVLGAKAEIRVELLPRDTRAGSRCEQTMPAQEVVTVVPVTGPSWAGGPRKGEQLSPLCPALSR